MTVLKDSSAEDQGLLRSLISNKLVLQGLLRRESLLVHSKCFRS